MSRSSQTIHSTANPASVANLSNNGATQDEYPNWAPGAGDPEDPVVQISALKVTSRKRTAILSFTGREDVDPRASGREQLGFPRRRLTAPGEHGALTFEREEHGQPRQRLQSTAPGVGEHSNRHRSDIGLSPSVP